MRPNVPVLLALSADSNRGPCGGVSVVYVHWATTLHRNYEEFFMQKPISVEIIQVVKLDFSIFGRHFEYSKLSKGCTTAIDILTRMLQNMVQMREHLKA